jgi:hypothetical protein
MGVTYRGIRFREGGGSWWDQPRFVFLTEEQWNIGVWVRRA